MQRPALVRALTLRSRLSLVAIGLSTVLLGSLGFLMFRDAEQLIRRGAMERVSSVAQSRKVLVIHHLEDSGKRMASFLEDAARVCSDPTCWRDRVEAFLRGESAEAAALSVPDVVVTHVGPSAILEDLPEPVFELRAQPYRSSDGRSWFAVTRASPSGAILQVVWKADRLDPLLGVETELGQSGESFLASADGFFVTAPRYGSTAGHSHPIDASPMVSCLSGKDGVVIARDYRGVEVVHGFRYLRSLGGACIMAHMDAEEVFAPVQRLGMKSVLLSGVAILAAIAAALVLAYRLARPIAAVARYAEAVRDGELNRPPPRVSGTREQRAFAETLSKMVATLRESQQVRERFIGVLAHDLRNPLDGIILSADLLKRGRAQSSEELSRTASRISRSAKRMGRMITELLDCARSQGEDGLPIHRTMTDLGRIVEAACDDLRAANPRRTVQCRVEGNLVGQWDGDRIEQVTLNLVENALRYGSPACSVDVEAHDQGDQVVLSVHNSCTTPIPPNECDRLFAPYQRGDEGRARTKEGLGLGLYIVKEILRAHGGRIDVLSSGAEGTTFSTHWPRSAAVVEGRRA